MNLQNMLKGFQTQLSEMQSKQQQERESVRLIGEAGGGIVKVTLDGNYKLIDFNIDFAKLIASNPLNEEAKNPGYVTIPEDDILILPGLVMAAYEQARKAVAESNSANDSEFDLNNFKLPFNPFGGKK